jgi:magnesium-transporting ATPase (P-type)
MSTSIYKDVKSGECFVYTKGADSSIKKVLREEDLNSGILNWHDDVTEKYSVMGLRTLYIAKRSIDEEDVKKWDNVVKEAKTKYVSDKDAKEKAIA